MSSEWTKDEYEAALESVLDLWGAEAGSDRERELMALCDAVEVYEDVHHPIQPCPPGLSKETLHAFINAACDCSDCVFSMVRDGLAKCTMLRSQIVNLHHWVQDWVNEDGTVKDGAPSCPCWSPVGERREGEDRRCEARRNPALTRLVRPEGLPAGGAFEGVLQGLLADDPVAAAKARWPERAQQRAGMMGALMAALPDKPTPPVLDGPLSAVRSPLTAHSQEAEVVALFDDGSCDPEMDKGGVPTPHVDPTDGVLQVPDEILWNEYHGAIDHHLPLSTHMIPPRVHAGPCLWYHGTDEETAAVILREGLGEGSWLTPYLAAAMDFGGPVVFAVMIEDAPHHGTNPEHGGLEWQWATDARIGVSRLVSMTRYEQHVIHRNPDAERRLRVLCALDDARRNLESSDESMWLCHTCDGTGCFNHEHACDHGPASSCIDCEEMEMCMDCGGHGTLFSPEDEDGPPPGAEPGRKVTEITDAMAQILEGAHERAGGEE